MGARTDYIRKMRFAVPVYAGMRCVTVTLLEQGGYDRRGCTLMRVRFTATLATERRLGVATRYSKRVMWEADGFAGSPLHADDSAQTMGSAVTLALHCGREDGTLPAWLESVRGTLEPAAALMAQ